MREKILERRGPEGYVEDAEKKIQNLVFLFCELYEVFAPSAFRLFVFIASTLGIRKRLAIE
jgi:hypothetical protein